MRTYYDHEAGYRAIAERGGTGWDDCPAVSALPGESYAALDDLLHRGVPPSDAIDLGCGGGQAAIRLARCGFRVTGVDFAPTAIVLARANAEAAGVVVRFVEGDCLDLSQFASASFDFALDNHALHCLIGADRARFLGEAARVLRPGGLLFSDSMSREGDFDPTKMGCDPVTFVSQRGNRYWVSESELAGELAAAGFEILSTRRVPDVVPGIGDALITLARR